MIITTLTKSVVEDLLSLAVLIKSIAIILLMKNCTAKVFLIFAVTNGSVLHTVPLKIKFLVNLRRR